MGGAGPGVNLTIVSNSNIKLQTIRPNQRATAFSIRIHIAASVGGLGIGVIEIPLDVLNAGVARLPADLGHKLGTATVQEFRWILGCKCKLPYDEQRKQQTPSSGRANENQDLPQLIPLVDGTQNVARRH